MIEHAFHVFIPGTPENIALMQIVPMWGQISSHCYCWWCNFRRKSDD